MNNSKFSKLRIKTSTLNFVQFMNKLLQCNIEIFEIEKKESDVFFTIYKKDYKKFKVEFSNREYLVVGKKGFSFLIDLIKNRLGFFLGLIVGFFVLHFSSYFVFSINICGLENINKEIILSKLEEIDIKTNSIVKLDNEYIENYLLSEIDDISIASVKRVGTSLIINIKEKIANLRNEYSNLVAEYNMMIKSINVYSGVANVKKGDFVKKGDILVYAYDYDGNGNIVECEVVAEVDVDIWVINSSEFKTNDVVKRKTGNKFTQISVFLGNNLLYSTSSEFEYENYEIENKEFCFCDFLLPITIKKVIYYEIEDIEIVNDFELMKDKLISDCYQDALEKVPEGLLIENEEILINEIESGYLINVYLKCNMIIRR